MRKLVIIILSALIVSLFFTVNLPAKQRGIRIVAKSGQSLYLYKDYHALVVGVSDYNKWPDLPNAVKDAKEVASTLRGLGFTVKTLLDPTSKQLKTAFSDIAFGIGSERNRAVLFYFAGHGETLKLADGTELGYIIPKDCPLKTRNPIGFDDKAISMKDIEVLALKVKSKHFLMLFDSCFSGSLFNLVRAAPVDITEKSAKPVRQFITAGGPGEQVPDRSIFKIVFLDGIKGYADLNGDGYVTGSELGMHLQDKVVNYTRGGQHPQYGKINNPKLDKGDFIFRLASSGAVVAEPGKTTISVECNVAGARVLVDGREIGWTPLIDLPLSPGEHQVRVVREGYDPYRKRVRLERGRSLTLYVDLSKARPRTGRLYVETEPEEARVRVLNIRPRFYQGIELDPGRYHLEISAKGYEPERRWVQLAAGEDRYISIHLRQMSITAPAAEGAVFKNSIGMKFVLIPPGTFTMGSPSDELGRRRDERQHRVTLSKPFYLQTTEVTQAQWREIMGNNPSRFKAADHPVESVSWHDGQEYIKRLNEIEGTDKYRLPTETEWEYACRAGSTTRFCFGDDAQMLGEYAWYYNNSNGHAYLVRQKKPNAWGLYDMHGNVWEWCQDWHGPYPKGHVTDPKGPSSGKFRTFRGGCWGDFAREGCRSACRIGCDPGNRDDFIGFRVARDF